MKSLISILEIIHKTKDPLPIKEAGLIFLNQINKMDKIKNPAFKIGDVIKIGIFYYLLAKVSNYQCNLISLEDGENYTDSIIVQDFLNITQKEMELMICDTSFEESSIREYFQS